MNSRKAIYWIFSDFQYILDYYFRTIDISLDSAFLNFQNFDGDTVLLVAVKRADFIRTNVLLNRGADLNKKDKRNKTVFDYADTKLLGLLKSYENK